MFIFYDVIKDLLATGVCSERVDNDVDEIILRDSSFTKGKRKQLQNRTVEVLESDDKQFSTSGLKLFCKAASIPWQNISPNYEKLRPN